MICSDVVREVEGIHTYNFSGKYEVIDLKYHRVDPWFYVMRPVWYLWRRMKKVWRG